MFWNFPPIFGWVSTPKAGLRSWSLLWQPSKWMFPNMEAFPLTETQGCQKERAAMKRMSPSILRSPEAIWPKTHNANPPSIPEHVLEISWETLTCKPPTHQVGFNTFFLDLDILDALITWRQTKENKENTAQGLWQTRTKRSDFALESSMRAPKVRPLQSFKDQRLLQSHLHLPSSPQQIWSKNWSSKLIMYSSSHHLNSLYCIPVCILQRSCAH